MAELSQSFDTIMDAEMWTRVAAITAGYFAPTVLRNLIGGAVPDTVDQPELYGVAVVGGGQMAPMYQNEISLGGGIHTLDAAAERFDVKSTIVNMGA